MSYVMHLTFFIDASRQDNAERLFNSIKKETSVDLNLECIDPYHKGGHTIRSAYQISNKKWTEAVFTGIQTLQLLGYGWSISGAIQEELSAETDRSVISGIDLISVSMHRK